MTNNSITREICKNTARTTFGTSLVCSKLAGHVERAELPGMDSGSKHGLRMHYDASAEFVWSDTIDPCTTPGP